MPKIIISNCWSYDNKGDAAIALGAVELINKINKDVEITALAFDEVGFNTHKEAFGSNVNFLRMPTLYFPLNILVKIFYAVCHFFPTLTDFAGHILIISQLGLFKIVRLFSSKLRHVLSEIDDSQLVIAVGGNYLYSHVGLFNHLIPLLYAKNSRNKQVILLCHSIGPFNNNYFKNFLVKFFESVDYIYLREDISKDYLLNDMKIKNNKIKMIGDLSFILKDDEPKEFSVSEIKNIGISIRQWLFDDPKLYNRYIDTVKNFITYLLGEGYNVFIVPFSYASGKEYDLNICEQVYNEVNKSFKTNNLFLLNFKNDSPRDIINTYKKLEIKILIGTRLHSTLLAAIADIPSVIISYQHFKAYGISRQLGLEEYVIKIEEVTYDELCRLFNKLLNNYSKIQSELGKSVCAVKQNMVEESVSFIKSRIDY